MMYITFSLLYKYEFEYFFVLFYSCQYFIREQYNTIHYLDFTIPFCQFSASFLSIFCFCFQHPCLTLIKSE